MNGTTNFMLCKMEDDGMFYVPTVFAYFPLNIIVLIILHHDEGADYGEVLKEAQALGFAEADPTADVEGYDVQAKISILGNIYVNIIEKYRRCS